MKKYISVQKNSLRENNLFKESGVTMIEFALVVGVVLTFVLGIIDLSLYYHNQGVLRETARRLTKLATVDSEFATDTRTIPNSTPPTADKIELVKNARARIIENAFGAANSSILARKLENGSSEYEYTYADDGYGTPGGTPLPALILRPGERASESTTYAGDTTVSAMIHPNCNGVDDSSDLCLEYLSKPGNEAWTFMQRNLPFYAEVKARVRTILFGTVEVTGRSVAWKDITGSNKPDDFADVPAPQTCNEAYPTQQTQDDLCRAECGDDLRACEFLPTNYVSNKCTSCKTCEEFTSADEVCAAAGCEGGQGSFTQECIFHEREDNSNQCGRCQNRSVECDYFTSEAEACEKCHDTNEECTFGSANGGNVEVGDVLACASCEAIQSTCGAETNEATACSSCGGVEGNAEDECRFDEVAGNLVDLADVDTACNACFDREGDCAEFTNADDAETCGDCGGQAGDADQLCTFNGANSTSFDGDHENDCGGCVFRQCEAENPGLSNGEVSNPVSQAQCAACNVDTQFCDFVLAHNVQEGCFFCRPLPCSRRVTEAQYNEYCANRPEGFECTTPYDGDSTAANCYGGDRRKTCVQRIADGDISGCDQDSCDGDPNQVCDDGGNSRAVACVTCRPKTCVERFADGDITNETECGPCNGENQVCERENGTPDAGDSCATCRTKGCAEAGITETDACDNCSPNGFTCEYDPDAIATSTDNCRSCSLCEVPDCRSQNLMLDETGCRCTECTPEGLGCEEGALVLDDCTCDEQPPI